MSKDQTLPDTPSVTSSPESEDGPSPSNSPGGIQLDLFGPAVSHPSRSATPEAAGENPTSDTSGLSSSVSSRSANLQLSLENRLRQDLAVNGSPEYELTWKQWGMESGLPICALRASGHHISDSVSTLLGWPSPSAQGSAGEISEDLVRRGQKLVNSRTGRVLQTNLATEAKQVGWPSPNTRDTRRGCNQKQLATEVDKWLSPMAGWPPPTTQDDDQDMEQRRIRGEKFGFGEALTLGTAARMGWPTPQAADGGKIGSKPNFGQVGLSNHPALHGYPEREPMQKSREGDGQTTNLSGWNSPRATDGSNGGPNQSGGALSNDAAGSATPPGQTQSGSPSETGNKGVLNPALPLWLQGFPSDWLMVAPTKLRRGRKRSEG